MSFERRMSLIEAHNESVFPKGKILQEVPMSLRYGNWDLAAYSYQRSFEVMWDYANTDGSGLSSHALLMVCRQSIELSIKSAIAATTSGNPPTGHRLLPLFNQLMRARKEAGLHGLDDDDYTLRVRKEVRNFHDLDPNGDRFRYPSLKDGQPYRDVEPNLDRLFVTHLMITGWCDRASVEAEQLHLNA